MMSPQLEAAGWWKISSLCHPHHLPPSQKPESPSGHTSAALKDFLSTSGALPPFCFLCFPETVPGQQSLVGPHLWL